MPSNWESLCSICASSEHRGVVTISRGIGAAAAPEGLPLCTPCFSFLAEALRHPASGDTTLMASMCDLCSGPLPATPNIVTLEPRAGAETMAPPFHRLEQRSSLRLCDPCLAWAEELIEHESVARWGRRRPVDAPEGSPAQANARDAVGIGLAARDGEMVRDTIRSLGGAFDVLAARDGTSPSSRPLFFVQAGQADEAEAFTQSLPEDERWRVVVVTGADGLRDATAALRLGAGDFLAAPLSRQQVAGALDRVASISGGTPRDPRTGVPQPPLQSQFGLPAHLLRVSGGTGADAFATAVVLRRYLRGYDGVTVVDDRAEAHIFCEGTEVGAVVRRLSRILGPGYCIAVCGLAEPEGPRAVASTKPPSRPDARNFFGRALGRAS